MDAPVFTFTPRTTLAGLTVALRPPGATNVEIPMVPLNSPRPVTVIVEEVEEPELILMRVGAETVKSTTLTVTVTV